MVVLSGLLLLLCFASAHLIPSILERTGDAVRSRMLGMLLAGRSAPFATTGLRQPSRAFGEAATIW
ncbi:hypothetical protein IVB14_32810 [Bradyrhizobium sp. 180]|uniref:hypothetical protein n=1 Tax=unclassified Bradyrhizobium TaxID=2631580 RepID=UPI0031F9A7AF|nr:hypothetical protein [Bradyrhizobium sp. 180]MCK1621541.1 hypothetical protein [Bradyrhizobium sp. 159]MCK1669821.1 hypothetical protein [Bradyrhizobium sp. 153]MCK1758877.1 hypothetical protein [Bradyrhizobium sp. 137]